MVALFPLIHKTLVQVLVGQSERTEAFACIVLFWLDSVEAVKNKNPVYVRFVLAYTSQKSKRITHAEVCVGNFH